MISVIIDVIAIAATLVAVGCAIYAVASYVDLKKTVKKWEETNGD